MSGVYTRDGDELLTRGEAAELAGIMPDTFSAYRYRGQASIPEPVAHVGRIPLWARSAVERWNSARRADLDRTDRATVPPMT